MGSTHLVLSIFVLAIQCGSDAFAPAYVGLSRGRLSGIHASFPATRQGICALSMKTETLSRERKLQLMEFAKQASSPLPETTVDVPADDTAYEVAQVLSQYTQALPMTCGKYTRMGLNTQHVNQDDATIFHSLEELDGASILSVLDGHGFVGLNVAQRLSRAVPRLLVHKVLEAGSVATNPDVAARCLKETFKEADKALQESGVAEETSGATATVALVQDRHLAVGWLGDSRAVIGGHTQGGIGRSGDYPHGIKGGVHVERLTRDHVPTNTREQLRILTTGGEIKHKNVKKGIDADYVYYRGKEFPGLGVTRSFGDFNGKLGNRHLISSDPDVLTRRLRESDEVLVMASDGLWQWVSDAEAIQGALKFLDSRDANAAAKHLCELARERWLKRGQYADDITAVVSFL